MYEIEFNDKERIVVSPNSISENLVSWIEEIKSIMMKLDQIDGIRFQKIKDLAKSNIKVEIIERTGMYMFYGEIVKQS